MTESQYQTLLRVVAAAIIRRRKEKEVKKDEALQSDKTQHST